MNNNINTNNTCSCGCGTECGVKSIFAPGHDARHASAVARGAASAFLNTAWEEELEYGELLQQWIINPALTPALAVKALNIFFNLVTNPPKDIRPEGFDLNDYIGDIEALRGAVPATPAVEGKVKVGRWEYPAKRVNGVTYRNSSRDGSGEWVETGAKFIA